MTDSSKKLNHKNKGSVNLEGEKWSEAFVFLSSILLLF